MGIEPTNLLHAMQALYQLSYAPAAPFERSRAGAGGTRAGWNAGPVPAPMVDRSVAQRGGSRARSVRLMRPVAKAHSAR